MRIGVSARILHTAILEGVGRYIWETTKRMVVNHPEHTFYLYFDRNYPEEFIFSDNMVGRILSPPARHPFLFLWWFEISLKRQAKKDQIDVLYFGDNFLPLSSNIPSLLVIHDLAYRHFPEHIPMTARWYYRRFMPRFAHKAGHIIAVSKFGKNDIVRQLKVAPEKITVAYNALPQRNISPSVKPDFPYLIYVGSINQRKNILNVLKAFARFNTRNPDYKFLLIGHIYALDKHTIKQIEDLIEKGLVMHKTGVSDEALSAYIAHAAAMVYASFFEGFGIPILEAMALGTPVITSNVSAMPEIAGGAAILVNPDSVPDISKAMHRVVNNSELREKLIDSGYRRLKDFSWDSTSEIIYSKLEMLSNSQ